MNLKGTKNFQKEKFKTCSLCIMIFRTLTIFIYLEIKGSIQICVLCLIIIKKICIEIKDFQL